MRIFFLISLLWFSGAAIAEETVVAGGECLACHTLMEDENIAEWKDDVHSRAGIGCQDCHGGDSKSDDMDIAKSKKAGFRGVPKPAEIPEFCGRCHSSVEYMKKYDPAVSVDQVEKYWTSIHGKKLKEGDNKVATCVSCHSVHGIRKVSDAKAPVYATNLPKMCAGCHADAEYMAEYRIPTTQYADYIESVHGKAILEKGDVRGAPACNDCHGNHGATPPGLNTVSHVCGACHAHNAELFLNSPMAGPFKDKALGECAACHGQHRMVHASDDWIGDRSGTLCSKCHKEGDEGLVTAEHFATAISKVKGTFSEASSVLKAAHLKGMDITEGDDYLQAGRQSLIQARTIVHAFSKPLLDEKLKESKTSFEKAIEAGKGALKEYTTRRIGLAVSTFFLVLLTIALAFKIRSLPPPETK